MVVSTLIIKNLVYICILSVYQTLIVYFDSPMKYPQKTEASTFRQERQMMAQDRGCAEGFMPILCEFLGNSGLHLEKYETM